ncbi:MAG: hypothetical protein ACTHLW_11670, partial [Verrucomicrobiota bacterium]
QAFPSVSAWTKAMFEPFAATLSNPPVVASMPVTGGQEELLKMVKELQKQVAKLKREKTAQTTAKKRK